MLASERHARISEMLRTSRIVSSDELAHVLDVSTETIRRDLVVLEGHGELERVHGGARSIVSVPVGDEPPFVERSGLASAAKTRIGLTAANLVKTGQTIIIDVGTTALHLARALPYDFMGVVATCSLLAAIELADRPNVEVIVSGGCLRAGDLALSNGQTQNFFDNIFADVAFLGSGGVDAEAGLTDFYLDEAIVRRSILRNSRVSYVLADATKFGRVARHRVAGLDEVTGIVTDAHPSLSIMSALPNPGSVIIAD